MKHRVRGAVAALALAVVLPFAIPALLPNAAAAPRITSPDGGAAGAAWTATEDGPQPYPNVHIDWDIPIPMSDGTVLKANLYRPADAAGRPIAAKLPTILHLTPYTKLVTNIADSSLQIVPWLSDAVLKLMADTDLSGTPLAGITDITKAFGNGLLRTFAVDRQLIRGGYAQLVVDVRGTGFSQGIWDVFQHREQQDTIETINWAARQPWSNGKLGMSGESYSGINQLQAAERHPAALKAIFPIIPGSDLMQDVIAPGGAVGITFLPLWLAAVNGTKLVPDLQALAQGRFDMKWLHDRVADPLTFLDAVANIVVATKTSDLTPRVRNVIDHKSSFRKDLLGHPDRIRIPTFVTGGWHDLFTNSESKVYDQIPLPTTSKKLLMGNFYHLNPGNENGKPGQPPRLAVLQRAWFDRWLKGIDNGIDRYGPVVLRQQGGDWVTRGAFIPPAPAYRRMYLSAAPSGAPGVNAHDGSLRKAPSRDRTRLTVAPGLASLCSNDTAQATMGAVAIVGMCGRDSRVQEISGLTFTSPPVKAPTTIGGPLAVHLQAVHDAADGYWNVTVNDVAPDGQSTVLTTGQLVASLRAIDPKRSTRSRNGDYTDPVPYLSLAKRLPVVPGRPTALDITLQGTNAVLQPGHRLRVDVYAGNLAKSWAPTPFVVDSGLRPQHILLDPAHPSYLNVAITGKPGW